MSRTTPFDLKALAALKSRPKRFDYRDPTTPGLVLTVTPAGSKVERVRIAPLEDVQAVEDVRQVARQYNVDRGKGEDPAEKLRAVKWEMKGAELWTMYLDRHAKANKRDWKQDEQRWKLRLRAAVGSRPLSSIKRAEVVRLLEKVKSKAGPVQANRVRALQHTMFEKAREWGLDLNNPVSGTPRNREAAKERYLAPKELRAFIRAARKEPDADVRDFVLLLLLTGVRAGTLKAAAWSDLNLRDGVWKIPASAMKAGRPLVLPLASPVVELLRGRRELQPESTEAVFPSPRAAKGYLNQVPQKGWRRIVKACGVAKVSPHTLRRTFVTYAVGAGTPIEVISRLLGHTQPGGITAIYARVHTDLVRQAVEATVKAMLAIADAPEDKADVLAFPVPRLAAVGAQ